MLKIIIPMLYFFHSFANASENGPKEELFPYDFNQKEVKQFIAKKHQVKTSVYNESDHPIKIKTIILKEGHQFEVSIKVGAHRTYTFSDSETLFSAALKPANRDVFLKVEEASGYRYNLVLTNSRQTYRPKFIPFVNFTPQFLGGVIPHLLHTSPISYGPMYQVNPPKNLDKDFAKQYNEHLDYLLNVIFPGESINADDYFETLNTLYKKYELSHLFNKEFTSPHPFRIPQITHTIWLTNPNRPVEFPEKYIHYLLKSVEACSPDQGYQHILWVNDKGIMPETVKRLACTPIKIEEVKSLGKFDLEEEFKLELESKRFGKASDIIRLVILEKMGGVYKDTDYRIHQSLDPLLKLYDFVGGREPMSAFICNAFIAAKPKHPIIRKYLKLIKRNYSEDVPAYIKSIHKSDGFSTILVTGPSLFTAAIAHKIGIRHRHDIILPHQYIYPTVVDSYPQIKVIKPGLPVPDEAFGAHYWDTSWVSEENGSIG